MYKVSSESHNDYVIIFGFVKRECGNRLVALTEGRTCCAILVITSVAEIPPPVSVDDNW